MLVLDWGARQPYVRGVVMMAPRPPGAVRAMLQLPFRRTVSPAVSEYVGFQVLGRLRG